MESRIEMSQHERDVLAVMNRVLLGERTQSEAAGLLHLSERQVRRIQRRLEAEGDGAVVHRLRGRPSNRQLSGKLRERGKGKRDVTNIDRMRGQGASGPRT